MDPSVFSALPRDIQDELLALQGAAWSCRACTFLNHPQLAECEMCGTLCVALEDARGGGDSDATTNSNTNSNTNTNNNTNTNTNTNPPAGTRLGRSLRRLRVPPSPAAVSFAQKKEPTAEDLVLAASSRLQSVRRAWQGRRSRADSAADQGAAPSLQARSELTELQRDLHHKVKAGDEWFEASLERLWRAVGGERGFERSAVDWVALGFQNASPETDFRGGGVLALKCLVYAFEAHPNEMRDIQMQQMPDSADGKHKKRGYPVCVAGINLTCLLAGLLQLGDGTFSDRKETFWQLFEEPAAFYELFFLGTWGRGVGSGQREKGDLQQIDF
ncbi:unnamed protein product [Phytophthora fragariaefolia]|uniref:Unnamed protein product n=1 Tax=Phytophthora fragariaefolia TaxID=1490495 RepID=A0A9W6XCX7_9STRA|nr:unnamed protein product [Phytophthora fragariaefolia]